jgi:hypothetical protein
LLCWTSLLAVSTSAFSVGFTARSSVAVQPTVAFAPSSPLQHRRHQSQQPSSSNRLYSSALNSAATKDEGPLSGNKVDRILSKLTSGFPLWVVGAALLALLKPATLAWVNTGQIIEIMLAFVMIGMGMTLEKKDFTAVFADNNWSAVPFGVLCQFGIMPIAAGLLVVTARCITLSWARFGGLLSRRYRQ